jgi:hypothetical protein
MAADQTNPGRSTSYVSVEVNRSHRPVGSDRRRPSILAQTERGTVVPIAPEDRRHRFTGGGSDEINSSVTTKLIVKIVAVPRDRLASG